MDEKLKKDQPPSSHSSGQHRLQLDEALRRNTPTQVEAAKAAFESAQTSTPPPSSRSPLPPPPSASSSEIKEMGEAATKLGESVDKVCEALVMVFGKISNVSDEAHGQTLMLRSLTRLMVVVAIIQGVVCVVMILLACLTWTTSQRIDQTHVSQTAAVRGLTELTNRVDWVAKSAEETKRAVVAVKKTADETATVQLVADPDKPGGAVVRIVPPRTPVPASSASSEATKAPPASPREKPVEIPVQVDGARTGKQDARP